jgi:hypothetical protein
MSIPVLKDIYVMTSVTERFGINVVFFGIPALTTGAKFGLYWPYRHAFKAAVYVEIARVSHEERVIKSHPFWIYFIREAPSILEKYGEGHNITVVDLILGEIFASSRIVCSHAIFITSQYFELVSMVCRDRRFAKYEFREESTDIPPDVQFIEKRDVAPGATWGEWINCNGQTKITR